MLQISKNLQDYFLSTLGFFFFRFLGPSDCLQYFTAQTGTFKR